MIEDTPASIRRSRPGFAGAGGRGNFGLTLIRGLAMQLGGDIAIAPRESGGTRMVVTFPMPRDEPAPGAASGATHA